MDNTISTLNRRNFLRITSLASAGLFIGLSLKKETGMAQVAKITGDEGSLDLTPFVHIGTDGTITLFNPRPEMGQGTFQSIPALIAEELEVSLDKVNIRQTGGQIIFGRGQSAGGSASVRTDYFPLRKVGASAREMLLTAASQQWNVPLEQCNADEGMIYHKSSGRSLSYGELAQAASKLPIPSDPKLKDPKDFRILGKPSPRPDIPLKSSGRAVFGIDVDVPGMVYASVAHSPVFGAKLVKYDDSDAKKVKGVLSVETCDRKIGKYTYPAIAVIAENYWAAYKGREALKIQWDDQGNEKFNTEEYTQKLRDLSKTEGLVDKEVGNFEQAYQAAPVRIDAFYETPVVSHSPIEPMNCVASWTEGNKLEIWASTQVPRSIVTSFSKEYGIPEDNVTVHTQYSGGAFGRRLQNDFVIEAAQLSKKTGKPVKVLWSREDDTEQGPFRPMTFSAMKGALSAQGEVVAFQHKVISPSLHDSGDPNFDPSRIDRSMTEGISDQAYVFPNMKNLYVHADFHVPISAWRAVTSTTLAFAHECFIDELAVKAGKDPLDFRLGLIDAKSDTHNVLMKLREVSQWDKPLPEGWGRGVAQYEFFAGLAGYVVEVSKAGSGIHIEKAYAVIDLGTMVNPDTVRGQVEGAATMALTAAIKSGITFKNGETVQKNFNTNQLVRIHEMPSVEVTILTNGGPRIKGVGEPGLPSFAPALCNAIFSATGTRIRRLPFDINHIA